VNFNCTVIIEIKCTIVRHLQTFRIKNYATVRSILHGIYEFSIPNTLALGILWGSVSRNVVEYSDRSVLLIKGGLKKEGS
jgi:hypothetical protein